MQAEKPSTINEENGCPSNDLESRVHGSSNEESAKCSAFMRLGLLDRFLAIWIFLAMFIGIILGNFVPNVGPALQKGTFVGVSIPIGASSIPEVIDFRLFFA